ncbi:stage II sporulation protein P [Cohnella kolymensis]|uniref:Stage II sporulation protein P n=1 Tax=Cohnella kolymensis TaxID=1590652 RepID=A0ABR5A826_9BACL|nr:stage II sporulation protein P [Cohnella kolymensis]KIL37179.1 stage II sporulation protein P [Cohnella kolymensis]
MKRIVVTLNWPRLRAKWRRILITGRAYFVLSFCSMIMFVLLGLGGMLQKSLAVSPVQSMKGFTASVSGEFFHSLLGMELPHMTTDEQASPLQADRIASFVVRFLTDLNPDDPKSLLALEMPNMDRDRSVLLHPGSGEPAAPEDHGPLDESPVETDEPNPDVPDPDAHDVPGPDSESQEEGAPAGPPEEHSPEPETSPSPDGAQEDTGSGQTTEGRKVVFIYHSHNRESFFPELTPGKKDPNSDKVNITLVGKRLAQQFEKQGLGSVHSPKDYASAIKGYNWNYSYKYSLQTVRQAMSNNKQLKFFFDIHRDSQHRKKTTATIDGKDYAQVYFIIGHRNPNWRQNEQFAKKIHEQLEKDYPGLSRGVWTKKAANGNGEYNQSVSPDSLLLEIGGVDNTLAECYRTADVLAKVISEQYWEGQEAEKVSAGK